MGKITNRSEEDRLKRSAWLLNPERTRENVILYAVVLLSVVAITFFIVVVI